jgi:hypothetical protein
VSKLTSTDKALAQPTGSATLGHNIDPLIALAFGIQTNPGAYALLIGSGVSRAAGIPTGWEVVTDLIEKVADLQDEDTEGDPAAWFRRRYETEPSYSALLGELAAEPSERNRLLRPYFEPTDDEREQGLKVPTAAHRAVARLVEAGYVRVIVTTNFDRLLELALAEVGVVPTTLATPDSVVGALPLAHEKCTIVKVHGDYLDARIRNTPEELASYEDPIDRLLDRIFDEYGLVICGWSGEWDVALRDAISRSPSRRFTTYWASRSELAPEAGQLLHNRRGLEVSITDADSFFVELEDKVRSLSELARPHPLSPKVAVTTLKHYLAEDRYRIRLHDLLADEVARVEEQTSLEAMLIGENQADDGSTYEAAKPRVARYDAICETLVALMGVGARWATASQRPEFVGVLDRLGNRWRDPEAATPGSFYTHLRALLDYPATLALYSAGLGAVVGNRLETLAHLLGDVSVVRHSRRKPLIEQVVPYHVIEGAIFEKGAGLQVHMAASNHVQQALREPLRELVSGESFTAAFDRFEYLLTLAYADLTTGETVPETVWVPVSSYFSRWRSRDDGGLPDEIAREASEPDWSFLKGPLFGGSRARFLEVKAAVDAHVDGLGLHPYLRGT